MLPSQIRFSAVSVFAKCISPNNEGDMVAWGEWVPPTNSEERYSKGELEIGFCQVNRLTTLEDLPVVCALG